MFINVQFNSIIELIKAFPNEQACINHLEAIRWDGNVVSPFDPSSTVYKCKGNKYRCKNTKKYFNVKTATLFDNSKIELQTWFLSIWLITAHKKGISSLQLGRDLNVTQKTAWFMLQRIRNCFGIENTGTLNNEVEIDETYIGGKNTNKHNYKKKENTQGRSVKDKTPVIGMIERKGKLIAKKIEDTKASSLAPEIIKVVKELAKIYTDEWVGYKAVGKLYTHEVVKHSLEEYVRDDVHTNSIEGFWALLKRGIMGIYHSTSKKHLQRYIDEFVFRYNTRNISENERFNMLITNNGCRLKYQDLIK